MLYKEIDSCIILNSRTSPRFPVLRGIRQGCPLSPFLFLFVVETLSIDILHNDNFAGLDIFNREIRISQLADDTTLFLKDKEQVSPVLTTINAFSNASGLKLNLSKCEIICLFDTVETEIENIPIKNEVKYLGIHITKNLISRQFLNFSQRLLKTKYIFNNWLQRDLSILGRVFLSKTEGLSRFVYPSLSLAVDNHTSKNIDKIFLDFIWSNKSHKLKKYVLANKRSDGGLEVLHFDDTNNTFKINWIKRCLLGSDSLWYFIPNNIFKRVGGLSFLMKCNYSTGKLPIKLARFHQQALLAWKLVYNHNFSPHKTILWNNLDIKIRKRSIFFDKWFNKNIIFVADLFNSNGDLLSYECFMNIHHCPVPFKEFNSVIKAIPDGLICLMKASLTHESCTKQLSQLFLGGVSLLSKDCNNKYIRQLFQSRNSISPKGKFFWGSKIDNIKWRKTWLLPYKYCIPNKVKEVHFKILHNIYPCNAFLSKFCDVADICTFCKKESEDICHLFFSCNVSSLFWKDLSFYCFSKINVNGVFHIKDIVCFFENQNKSLESTVNFLILVAKFYFHKQRFLKKIPTFIEFVLEVEHLIKSLRVINNKKCISFLKRYDDIFHVL
uniref:Reverse transcriptase domain-containing protein n=1 Tax=Cyprinus carpio TaxID=7962 RepID=A0A8C2C6C1_CYPCA